MQLGFVSAIFPEWPLADVLKFAGDEGFACVELMCWPVGSADRRYAGVTHVDVSGDLDVVKSQIEKSGIAVSGLGYYPNPLHPSVDHRLQVIGHLKNVIDAAPKLGVKVVNTFVGRNAKLSVQENWPVFQHHWPGIVEHAEKAGVTIGIENCPMLFTLDEWPGGNNLATTPHIWKQMFEAIPSKSWGLNIDPSHLIWQHIDYVRAVREFGARIVHVHAKDTKIEADKIYEHGSQGLGWHTPKLPGRGDVDWRAFLAAVKETGYGGPVCIEVEDREYEGSLADRRRALVESKRHLERSM